MDYFDDVFHTFLGLDSVNCLAVNGTVTSLPKTNEEFTGLERHGGKVIKGLVHPKMKILSLITHPQFVLNP